MEWPKANKDMSPLPNFQTVQAVQAQTKMGAIVASKSTAPSFDGCLSVFILSDLPTPALLTLAYWLLELAVTDSKEDVRASQEPAVL